MILCDTEIRALCERGLVSPYDPALVNPASLDVRLGCELLVEVDEWPTMISVDIGSHSQEIPYLLQPHEFVLGCTEETFWFPSDIAGQFALKSSCARRGIEHLLAGYCDPGWHNSKLTLELQNARSKHPVALWPGMRIGQIVFHRMSQTPVQDYSVTGHYNNDRTVMASKV